jgi:demethylmenaquinone methyltransferase/2-methoxy-6-polyprenyl-1,4-benzoquinol methylase
MAMAGRSATGGYDPSGIDLDEWEILESQLEESIPNYDRVNRLMTFGQDSAWRKNVRSHATSGMKVLEVGCGPGSFAEDIEDVDLTCLDPSEEMLKVARIRVNKSRNERCEEPAQYVQAIAESIPLEDNSFDRVFCLFSFRDFQDKKKGLEEIYRVLKPGGQLVICDAGKANWLHGLAGRIWMSTIVQLIARYVTKKKDHPWKGLAKTYSHYGTNGYYRKLMKEVGYKNVQGRLLLPFCMASRFRGSKPE